mgnify:CR=1 FL=1
MTDNSQVDLAEFELTVPSSDLYRGSLERLGLMASVVAMVLVFMPWSLDMVTERVDGERLEVVAGSLRGFQFMTGIFAGLVMAVASFLAFRRRWGGVIWLSVLAILSASFSYILMPSGSGLFGAEVETLVASWGLPYFNFAAVAVLLCAVWGHYGEDLLLALNDGLHGHKNGFMTDETPPSKVTVVVTITMFLAIALFLFLGEPDDKSWKAMMRHWF